MKLRILNSIVIITLIVVCQAAFGIYGEKVWADSSLESKTEHEESLWDDEWPAEAGGEDMEPGESMWDDAWSDEAGGEDETNRFELGGEIELRAAKDIDEDDPYEDDGYAFGKLIVTTEYKPGDQLKIVVSGYGDYFIYENDGDHSNDSTLRFDDTFINFSDSRFNIKLGNQVVRWGKADGYSPLDNLNPEDYRHGIAGRREDRKIPSPMANVEIYQDTLTLQGIFIPFFYEPELDTIGTDWAIFRHADKEIGMLGVNWDEPSRNINNSEYGTRLSGIFKNLNYAVSWLYTWEDIPTIDSLQAPPGYRVTSDEVSPADLYAYAAATGQTIQLTHDHQNIFGLELETTWQVFGLRADVAYSDNNSFLTDRLVRVQKPVIEYIAGVDYNSPHEWYANLQFSQTFIKDYDQTIISTDEVTSAFIGTFSKDFANGNYEFEIRGVYDLSGDGTMINPFFTIAYWNPLKIKLCAEFFDGSVNTPLGYYTDNDQAYGVIEYKF